MEYYLFKLVCCSDLDGGPYEYLWATPDDTLVGMECPYCHKLIEPNDGIHSWKRTDPESLTDVFMMYITHG